MNKEQKQRAEKDLFNRIMKLLTKLFFVSVTAVVVVTATQFFKTPKVEFVNVYYEDGQLNYEINIDPLDSKLDESSLNIVLSAHNERYEQKGVIGYQSSSFDVILHRSYTLKVEGDVGLGRQIFAEKKITIKDNPYVNLRSFAQVDDGLNIYFTMHNTEPISDQTVLVQITTQLETVYFETVSYADGVRLMIPNIIPGKNYTLRVFANIPQKTKLFEQAILTSDMPQINMHFETMQGMAFYNIRINDFFNRLSGEIDVELHSHKLISTYTHPITEPELFGEFMMREHPQGVYTLKVYGIVGFKRTLLVEKSFYNSPEAYLEYNVIDNKLTGQVILSDTYKLTDYTLYVELMGDMANEGVKLPLDRSLRFEFEIDPTLRYSLVLSLRWQDQVFMLSYNHIENTQTAVSVDLSASSNNAFYQITISPPPNITVGEIIVKITNDTGYNIERTYQDLYIQDEMMLDNAGYYLLEVIIDGDVVSTQSFYNPPQAEVTIDSNETEIIVEAFLLSDVNEAVYIDLYLDNLLIERQAGLQATFNNLSSDSFYEIRLVVLADQEYIIYRETHLFNPTKLTALLNVTTVENQIAFSFSLINPNEIAINQLVVRLTQDDNIVDEVIITDLYEGAFQVTPGDYILEVHHDGELIGSHAIYKPPAASLELSTTAFSITTSAYVEATTDLVYMELYDAGILIERKLAEISSTEQDRRVATFNNRDLLENEKTYQVRLVVLHNEVYHLIAQQQIIFNPPLEQGQIRILTADYIYDTDLKTYFLNVTYEHTMIDMDVYYLAVEVDNEITNLIEFTLDGSPLYAEVSQISPHAIVHFNHIASQTTLASSPLSNQYSYAVVDFAYQNGMINYLVSNYGPVLDNPNAQKVLRLTNDSGVSDHMVNFTDSLRDSFLGGQFGNQTLELIVDGQAIGGIQKYSPPTGNLTLRDGNNTLYVTPSLEGTINEPIHVAVYQGDTLISEQVYQDGEVTFVDLPLDTLLTIRLIIKSNEDDVLVTQKDYVVSTFFESFIYTTDGFQLTWRETYDLQAYTDLNYTIYFDDNTELSGSINLAALQPGERAYVIAYTEPVQSAYIVIYGVTETELILIGQDTLSA